MPALTLIHDPRREQAAAYALGALDENARLDFEVHLVDCPGCEDEVRSFAPVATALAGTAPPIDPDVIVRRRVLEAVSRAASPGGRAFTRGVGSAWSRAPWLVAAASLALAVGLGAYVASYPRPASNARDVIVVLAAADLVHVELAGQPASPRASARAFWSRSRGLVFTASSLPPLPAGRTYQLWIVTGQTPVGAGLMKPGTDGTVQAIFSPPTDLEGAVAFAVTIEPEGGVPAPTGDKFLVGLVN